MHTLQGDDCIWLVSKLVFAAEHFLDLGRLDLLYSGLTSPDTFKQAKPIPWRQQLGLHTGQCGRAKTPPFGRIKLVIT